MHTCRKRRACTSGASGLHVSSRPARGSSFSESDCRRVKSGPQLEGSRGCDVCTGACSTLAGTQLLCLRAGALLIAPGASASVEATSRAAGSARERQRACRATKMPSPASTCSPGTRCLGRASSCGRRGRGAAGGCACCRPGRRTCCEARRRRSAMVASAERGSPRSSSPLPVHIGAAAAAPPPSALAGLVGLAARRSAAHAGGAASQRIANVRARSFAGDYQ